jgi:hypothetical protein
MSAAAAAAAPAPEEGPPKKKAHSKPKRVTDFEQLLDKMFDEILPEDRKMPLELIELMTEYVHPCVNNDSWNELTDDWETGVDHKWNVFRSLANKFHHIAKCTFCREEHPVVVPL